ncbi:hypothetical protein F8566_38465 [Actinomadura rudentiformis]|uniref:CBM2 domain-containing protein n=1 Tax=Actinomadura rudentiformis TaxID=359158 RepID=A0A6H9YIQ0_9ACTN|nr:hypothetical protein F8566_38465 [Actinomadura rudentiformis]
MSGQEPGYVPPDHKTTAEFQIPGKDAEAESTMVDQPVDDPEATHEDFPEDGVPPAAEPPATVTDLAVEEPVTVTDFAADIDEPVTVTDFTADTVEEPDVPVAGGAMSSAMSSAMPAAEEVTAPQAAEEQPPVANEQPDVPDEHDLWTVHFGAEEETAPAQAARPAETPPFLAPPAPDVHQQPAAASHQPPLNVPPQQLFVPPSGDNSSQQATSPTPPPPMPGAPMPQAPAARGRSRWPVLLVAIGAVVAILAVAAVGAVLWQRDDGSKKTSAGKPAPSATPTASATPSGPATATPSGTPAATATPTPTGAGAVPPTAPVPPTPTAPPVGPVVSGNGITYQLMQQDPGYYEGRMVFTNRTGKPMKSWKITFDAPGANVKNIWGARLVRKGDRVEIQPLKGAPPVPPGATWEIQYGAAGTAANPKGCKINGKACGF